MDPTLGGRLRAAISNRLFIVTIAGAIAALGGCATSGNMAQRSAPNLQPAGLIVRNNNWNSMTIFLVQGGLRRRVGDVEGFSVTVIPSTRLGEFGTPSGTFLVARPLGGRAFRSAPLLFEPGRTLVWTIENQPAHSYLSFR